MYPTYFTSLDVIDSKEATLLDAGFYLFSPENDADGCRIVLGRPAVIDVDKFTGLDILRANSIFYESIADVEEVQISGLKIILDFSETHLNLFGLFSFTDYRNLADIFMNSLPFRVKAIFILNLPSFAQHILEFVMKIFSKKMKERVILLKDASELKKFMDVSLLPKEYNGSISMEDYIKYVKDFLYQNRQNVVLVNETDVDLVDRSRETYRGDVGLDFGAEGSFRKLEID
jgi:hypothetical protein